MTIDDIEMLAYSPKDGDMVIVRPAGAHARWDQQSCQKIRETLDRLMPDARVLVFAMSADVTVVREGEA